MFCYIYKIIKNDAENDDMIYIGSTCEPDTRWQGHKNVCNNPKKKGYNFKVYKYIRDNCGIEEWQMIILDEFEIPLKNCVERDNYEKDYIIKYDATNKLNVRIAGRTGKEWFEDNKEKLKEKHKEYYENNKEKKKEYSENNKDKIKEYQKEKIICSNCGTLINRHSMYIHKRSNKCTNFKTSSNQTF